MNMRLVYLEVTYFFRTLLYVLYIPTNKVILKDFNSSLEYLIFIEPLKCASRWSLKSCNIITDRESCLTTIESRHAIVEGVDIFGSECAWCDSGPCKKGSSSMCEPESLLQARGTSYATCLEIKENGKQK